MDVTGFLDRRIPFVDRPDSVCRIFELLLEPRLGEKIDHPLLGFVVQGRIDTMADENREADLFHRRPELLRELSLPVFTTVEEQSEITRLELKFLVDAFRKTVGLRALDLVVLLEGGTRGVGTFGS